MARIHVVSAAVAALALVPLAPLTLQAWRPSPGCSVEILVNGEPARTYRALGSTYVEALRGREYSIRLHNPYDVRVAVALSVDGLNTIDARHTTAGAARKWVIDPHETITISGWQTSMTQARRFFFTSEEESYAQRLGRPSDIGVISAAFFREREPARVVPLTADRGAEESRRDAGAPAPPAAAAERGSSGAAAKAGSTLAQRDEYAATGIGDRTEHPATQVHLDLESAPAASVDIRYEYRAQLVRLGVLPDADPLSRRQNAHGFDKSFCPDIR